MNCEQAQEWITALVDNELSAAERRAVDDHLAICHSCQQVLQQERELKTQLRRASAAITAPAALRRKISETFEEPSVWHRAGERLGEFWKIPWARPALAVALLLLVLSPLLFRSEGDPAIALAAVRAHAEIETGGKNLVRASDPTELKQALVQAVDGRFEPMGFDLSMMRLYPVGGYMDTIDGRRVLVTVYRGEGADVTCFTFLGGESDAPADAEVTYDSVKKINFYSYSKGDYHAVMHREGEVICIMVSKMPAAQLLALVRDKARHA